MNQPVHLGLVVLLAMGASNGCRSSNHFRSEGKRMHLPLATADKQAVSSGQGSPDASIHESVQLASAVIVATPLHAADLAAVDSDAVDSDAVDSDAVDSDAVDSDAVVMAMQSEVHREPQSIDLTTALLLTTGQNPQIAFAKARIEESLAQLDRANALKLPSLRAGVNYNKHEGRIQDVAGQVIETSRGSFYSGLGADAVGAGSPAVPGIVSQFHVADAIFQPRIAQRTACARQAGANATTNDMLLATALAYNELLRAEQDRAVCAEIVVQAERLVSTTGEFAKSGEGLESDYARAKTELALRRNDLFRSEEMAAMASARLVELVRWDTDQRLIPAETQLLPIHLSDRGKARNELVATALGNRPELAESRHLVGEAVERLNRERNAPLIPSVLFSASYGGLGGGLGSSLTNYGDRFDADAVAFWELRQLGLGETAIRREAKSRITQARMRDLSQMDRIAREVTEAHAQIVSRQKQMTVVDEAMEAANESYEKNWDRIRNGQGLPIEVLQSIQALASARREYVRVVADYNAAEFHLHRALGWPISDPSMYLRTDSNAESQ